MQLDLKKIPFGKRLSRHMLYEETDNLRSGWTKGLYLALAADSGGSFIGGPMMGPRGFALVTPVSEGKDLEYTLSATASAAVLKTEKGSVRFAIDGTKVLRTEGSGIGLRINGRLGFGGIAVMTKRGIEITMAGGIYLITARRGELSLDCHWELKALRSTDPVITVEPDKKGTFDLALYDTNDAYSIPELLNSFNQCVAESEAEFNSFTSSLTKPAAAEEILYDNCAYALWTGFQSFKGMELVPSSKMADMNIYSIEQPIVALPFQDAERSFDIINNTLSAMTPQGMVPAWFSEKQNLYEAVPPVYAYAISSLVNDGKLKNIPEEKLSAFYDTMSMAIAWWFKNRLSDDGLVYYAYRHECNWSKEKIFGAGTPCASPDLAAYVALATDSLSKIAAMLGKADEALSWTDKSKKQVDVLTDRLWNGTGFISINPLTGDSAPAEGILTLIPLILGDRLPDTVIDALAEKAKTISFEESPIIPAALIIHGLNSSGKNADAGTAASVLLKSCIAGGANDMRGSGAAGINSGNFFSPVACAALLSFGRL